MRNKTAQLWPRAKLKESYIAEGVAFGEVLVGKLADETDVFFDLLSFLLHFLDAVLASFLLQPL